MDYALNDCLKYLSLDGPAATYPTTPLRGYEQQFTTANLQHGVHVLGGGGMDDAWWGDDMYMSDSNASEDSYSSVEIQPRASGDRDGVGAQAGEATEPGEAAAETILQEELVEEEFSLYEEDTTPRARRGGPTLRRRSSIGRVAYRWGLSSQDAAEIINNFESQQSHELIN